MKDFKIIELMELFDEDEVTTADQIDRPQKALDREMFDDFNKRNPMAGGGMLVQPSADGSRPGYATSKTKTNKFKYKITNQHGTFYSDKKPKSSAKEIGSGKFSMAERNRVTRIKYPEYNSYSELLKKEPAKAKTVMANLQYASVAGSKIKKKNVFTPLTTIQQNKILAEFPDADFSKGKFGFNQANEQTKFARVKRFIDRGYKPKFKKIPLKLQEEIKQKFSYFKDWNFDNYKYGVPSSGGSKTGRVNRENNILAQRVKVYISEPKPFKLAFSMDRPGSWMLQQMYRAWEHGNTDYEPVYNKNDKVIGMKENGKAYYANENVAPSNKVKLINSHPEFNKVQKFVNVANEAKLPLKDLGGYKNTKSLLALFPEGYESIKFTDLVSYLYKEQGVDATRNAIEKHHLKSLSDMGAPVDSKNLQLLRKDLNTLGNTITQEIKKGDTSRVSDLEKAGVKITVDGKTYGKGFQDPRRQFNRIIGDVTQKISSLDKTQFKTLLASFSANPKCRAKNFSRGGRIGYATGPADLSECAISGKNRLEKVIKEGVKLGPQEGALATQILKAGRSLGSAFTLSGLFGPAALAFTAAAEAGFVGYDMLTTGKTFKETIGDSLLNYALGEKTKIDPQKELFKRFSGLGYNDEQIGKFANVLNQTNTLNTILKQDLKVGNLQDEVKALREQPKDQFMIADDEMLQTDAAIRAEQKLKDEQKNLENLLINYRSQPPVGLNMEDTILGDMASGKFQKTQQDLQAANIFADIEKEKTAANRLAGLEGAISEQARADRIAGLEQDYLNLLQERGPQLTPFAGGGIAGLSGGIDEGPQTVSMNPDSQGLRSLKKRVKNI